MGFGLGLSCCCGNVGFSIGSLFNAADCGASGLVTDVDANISRLASCKMIVIPQYACGDPYSWTPGTNDSTLKTWIEAGGRALLCAEYNDGGANICMDASEVTVLNNLLGYLGSAIQISTKACDASCYQQGVNSGSPIVTGLANGGLVYAFTNTVTGGTALCSTKVASACGTYTWVAAELLGDGIVVVSGDTGAFLSGCTESAYNYEFLTRLFSDAISGML